MSPVRYFEWSYVMECVQRRVDAKHMYQGRPARYKVFCRKLTALNTGKTLYFYDWRVC